MSFHSASVSFETTRRHTHAAPLTTWTLRSLAQIWAFMGECHHRVAARDFLRSLDERAMHDLGYHRVQAEIAKPFWRDGSAYTRQPPQSAMLNTRATRGGPTGAVIPA